MKAYHYEIVDNVISYIALKYYQAFNKYITQTLMFKILALFDFRVLRQKGRPCLEFSYTARDRGPVPEEIYNCDLLGYECFSIKDKKSKNCKTGKIRKTRYFISTKEPNLDYLSPSEKGILDSLLKKCIDEKINGLKASDITHREIRAWQVAYYNTGRNSKMSYEDEFPGIDTKDENEMTIPELNFMKYRELSNV